MIRSSITCIPSFGGHAVNKLVKDNQFPPSGTCFAYYQCNYVSDKEIHDMFPSYIYVHIETVDEDELVGQSCIGHIF